MTLTQLRYIIALDDFKNFATAAEHCFVAQPTLSLQVKKLEQTLNIELFDRSKTPLVTTPKGEDFICQARQVMQEVEKLNMLSDNQSTAVHTNLTLAIIPTVACYLMAPLVSYLEKNHPEINLWIKELPTSQIITQVEQNKIDIGIVALPLRVKHLQETTLYYEPLVVHSTPKNKMPKNYISIDALKAFPILLLGDDHCFRNQSMKICGHAAKSQTECYSLETIIELVKIKNAATLLPQRYTEHKSLACVSFKNPKPARNVGFITKKNFFKPSLAKILEHAIQALMPRSYFSKSNKKLLSVELNH